MSAMIALICECGVGDDDGDEDIDGTGRWWYRLLVISAVADMMMMMMDDGMIWHGLIWFGDDDGMVWW